MRRPIGVALLLACAASASAARLPSGSGGGLPGLRQLPRLAKGKPPAESPGMPPSSNVTHVFRTLQRDLIFIERLSLLLFRTASRAIGWLQRWITRSLGYPPRVMIVELSGIIAADDDVRGARSGARVVGRPELLSADVLSGLDLEDVPLARAGGDNIINLARVDRLLTKAFNAHGARAVCARPRPPRPASRAAGTQLALMRARARAPRPRRARSTPGALRPACAFPRPEALRPRACDVRARRSAHQQPGRLARAVVAHLPAAARAAQAAPARAAARVRRGRRGERRLLHRLRRR